MNESVTVLFHWSIWLHTVISWFNQWYFATSPCLYFVSSSIPFPMIRSSTILTPVICRYPLADSSANAFTTPDNERRNRHENQNLKVAFYTKHLCKLCRHFWRYLLVLSVSCVCRYYDGIDSYHAVTTPRIQLKLGNKRL